MVGSVSLYLRKCLVSCYHLETRKKLGELVFLHLSYLKVRQWSSFLVVNTFSVEYKRSRQVYKGEKMIELVCWGRETSAQS